MITKILMNNYEVYDCRGLEAEKDDAKKGCANGSTYFAIDTGNVYMLKVVENPTTHELTGTWIPF